PGLRRGHRRAGRAAAAGRDRRPGHRDRGGLGAARRAVAAGGPVGGDGGPAHRARTPAGPPDQGGWRVSGRGVELAYASGWRLVRALPEPVDAVAFRAAADAAYLRRGPAVRRLEANLRRVVGDRPDPELSRLVRAGLRSYARYWLEVFRLPAMTPAQIRHR